MLKSDKEKWVSASDIGRAAFCPHYLELKYRGLKPSDTACHARDRGKQKHEEFARRAEDKRCYIASHLYGIDDRRTILLRQYRDRHLNSRFIGRAIIQFYYLISPGLVYLSLKSVHIERLLQYTVGRLVRRIGEEAGGD